MAEEKVVTYDPSGGRRNQQRIEEEEKALEELIARERGETPPEEEGEQADVDQSKQQTSGEEGSEDEGPEPKTEEEKVWKKRHGDLRRHTQKQINELKGQVEQLTKQLETEKTNPSVSEEKLNDVAERNPVIMALIEKRAKEIAETQTSQFSQKFEELSQKEEELLKEKNENKIRKTHEDYDDIVSSDDFHKWAGDQEWLHDVIYVDDYYKKPDAVVGAINLYKTAMGMTHSAQKQMQKDALSDVKTKSTTTPDTQEKRGSMKESFFTSQEFMRLPLNKQEEMMNKWNEAVREGKAIYDLSGKS